MHLSIETLISVAGFLCLASLTVADVTFHLFCGKLRGEGEVVTVCQNQNRLGFVVHHVNNFTRKCYRMQRNEGNLLIIKVGYYKTNGLRSGQFPCYPCRFSWLQNCISQNTRIFPRSLGYNATRNATRAYGNLDG